MKRTRTRLRALAALLAGSLGFAVLLVVAPQAAHADGVPLAAGDVLAATGNGQVEHFNSSGTLLDTLDTTTGSTYTTGMCFDSSGDMYVTNFSTDTISEFSPAGNLVNPTWATVPSIPESCTFDASNNMYVGGPGSPTIYEFNSSGTQINSFAVTGGSGTGGTDWLDLSADQCTILYTGEGGEILSYNVCTQTQNPDLTTSLPGPCFELRIRPNGEVMVACASEVVRLDSSGNVLQTYPIPGSDELFSMNLDPDGTSFWTGDDQTGEIYHVDIASGTVLSSFNSSPSTGLFGLSIVGGIVVSQPTLTLTPSTATFNVGTPDTLTATITDPGGSLSGQTVNFSVTGANTASGTGTTNASGQATFTYTGTNPGNDTVTASFTNEHGTEASGTASVTWVSAATPTTLQVNSATGDFADPTTVSAMLTNSGGPLSGKTVTFTLNGTETCSGTTDATGTASCSITPGEAAGTYTLAGSFAGDATDLASNASASFVVTHEETALAYTGATSAVNGQPLTLSGQLTTDDPSAGTGLAGKTVTFTLGSGGAAQTCSGTSDSTGSASCTIAAVNQTPGTVSVAGAFAGDAFYLPASASSTITVTAATTVPTKDAEVTAFNLSKGVVTARITTTASNDLLVAFVSACGPASVHQTAHVSGGGLTWTLVGRTNVQDGTSEIWTARTSGVVSKLPVKATMKYRGFPVFLTVVAFSNATGTGNVSSQSGGTGAPKGKLTTSSSPSWVWAVGNDPQASIRRQLPPDQTLQSERLSPTEDTFWVQSLNNETGPAGRVATISDKAPVGNPWNLTLVEIL